MPAPVEAGDVNLAMGAVEEDVAWFGRHFSEGCLCSDTSLSISIAAKRSSSASSTNVVTLVLIELQEEERGLDSLPAALVLKDRASEAITEVCGGLHVGLHEFMDLDLAGEGMFVLRA